MFAPIPSPPVPEHACETASGLYVDVVNPDPTTITIGDIAWSLCRQARFAGHTISEEVYSVGQHSHFVLMILNCALHQDDDEMPDLTKSLALWLNQTRPYPVDLKTLRGSIPMYLGALTHDGSEAYLVDLPSPVKRHELLREPYKAMEAKLQEAIRIAFDFRVLTQAEEDAIKWADLIALQIEAAWLMPSRGRGWSGNMPMMTMEFLQLFEQPMMWRDAHFAFMSDWDQLQEFVRLEKLEEEQEATKWNTIQEQLKQRD